jgi:hypothetical protein
VPSGVHGRCPSWKQEPGWVIFVHIPENGTIFAQQQIARAVFLGLGISRPEEIEFLTDDAASADVAAQVRKILEEQGI